MSANNIGCKLNSGYKIGLCYMAQGGVKELFLVPYNLFNLDSCQFDSNDKIINLNMASYKWFRMDMINETAEYNEKEVIDKRTGSIYWDQTLQIVFHRNNSLLRKQLLQMINSNGLVAIVGDNQNKYFLMGASKRMDVEAEIKIEKNFGGLNGQVLNFKGAEPLPAFEIIGSAITYSTQVITGGGSLGGSVEIPYTPGES